MRKRLTKNKKLEIEEKIVYEVGINGGSIYRVLLNNNFLSQISSAKMGEIIHKEVFLTPWMFKYINNLPLFEDLGRKIRAIKQFLGTK